MFSTHDTRRRFNPMTVTAMTIAGALGASAVAQSTVDRRIMAVGITPSTVSGSFFDIYVDLSVAVKQTSAPVDASTQVLLFRNGGEVPFALLTVGVLASGGSGFCGAGDCAGTCGTGYIDGAISTLLCLDDSPGCPGSNCGCECRFPSIKANFPGQSLEPGDQLTVILMPATGSFPEPISPNDHWTTDFDGTPYFWRRRAHQVDMVPAASGAAGLVDVLVKGDVAWRGLQGPTDLGFMVQLKDASGAVVSSVFVPGGAQPNGDPLACGGVGCGGPCGIWNGVPVDCNSFPNLPFLPCGCGNDWFTIFPDQVPGIVAGGSIVLAPAPGALPELPGLPNPSLPIPSACDGDLDGNGIVNGADIAVVLGTWGSDGAGDVNNDGTVNGADLAMVLGNWGPCDPV